MTLKRRNGLFVISLIVALIELGAILASMGSEPMNLVDGWGATRPADGLALVLAAIGCLALFFISKNPVASTMVMALAYLLFTLRDYEFGMTLPAMVAIFIVMVRGRHFTAATVAALICLAATFGWIIRRTEAIEDGGVMILAWVAFGTVSTVFFIAPIVVGDLVWARQRIRATENSTAAQ